MATLTFMGMRIVESDCVRPVPTIQVRENIPMTDEGRAKMNAWLLEMFGMKDVFYIWKDDTLLMNPRHVAMLIDSVYQPSNIGERT